MSSRSDGYKVWEIRFLLIVSIVATIWYSVPQLKYTLRFPYYLLQAFFPGFLAKLPLDLFY
jgi:hypothetical protein